MSYTTRNAVTIGMSSESTGNWEAAYGQTWTVPILVNVSKLVRLGRRPLSIGFSGGGYAAEPDRGPSWKFRSSITLLFPK